jgi:ABC-type transport system involved in multi-copper enzyme maturation permease subunit
METLLSAGIGNKLLPQLMVGATALIFFLGLVGFLRGSRSILRLIWAEIIKIKSHPFIYISIGILISATILAAHFQPLLAGRKESEWATFNSYQLFAYGAKSGSLIASYILVSFSSLLFAGEFDRGTIKLLLTRPIHRTEVFLSKVAIAVLLSSLLYGLVLYVSYFYAVWQGNLGPVWDTDQYLIMRSEASLQSDFWNTLPIAYLPLLTSCFLGIFISNLIDSSGFAVLIAFVLFLLLNFVSTFLGESQQMNFFTYYRSDGFEILRAHSEGFGDMLGYGGDTPEAGGQKEWFSGKGLLLPLWLRVPLVSMAGLILPAWLIFRSKNIHA